MTLWRWRVVLVLWMGLIFLASSRFLAFQMSSNGTEQWFGPLNYVVRKLAHITEYAVLCYLWVRAMWTAPDRFRRCLIWSAALSVLYAATDEIHQAFVPQRDGVWTDVLWDSAGILMAVYVLRRLSAAGSTPLRSLCRRVAVQKRSGEEEKTC